MQYDALRLIFPSLFPYYVSQWRTSTETSTGQREEVERVLASQFRLLAFALVIN